MASRSSGDDSDTDKGWRGKIKLVDKGVVEKLPDMLIRGNVFLKRKILEWSVYWPSLLKILGDLIYYEQKSNLPDGQS